MTAAGANFFNILVPTHIKTSRSSRRPAVWRNHFPVMSEQGVDAMLQALATRLEHIHAENVELKAQLQQAEPTPRGTSRAAATAANLGQSSGVMQARGFASQTSAVNRAESMFTQTAGWEGFSMEDTKCVESIAFRTSSATYFCLCIVGSTMRSLV
jgi:hypothetical protein